MISFHIDSMLDWQLNLLLNSFTKLSISSFSWLMTLLCFHSFLLVGLFHVTPIIGDSMKTMSWSAIPGIGVHRLIKLCRFVEKRSSVLSRRLSNFITWSRLQFWIISKNLLFICRRLWLPFTDIELQLMSGKLKSPPIHMTACLFEFEISLNALHIRSLYEASLFGGLCAASTIRVWFLPNVNLAKATSHSFSCDIVMLLMMKSFFMANKTPPYPSFVFAINFIIWWEIFTTVNSWIKPSFSSYDDAGMILQSSSFLFFTLWKLTISTFLYF